jgi:hypothetical protein
VSHLHELVRLLKIDEFGHFILPSSFRPVDLLPDARRADQLGKRRMRRATLARKFGDQAFDRSVAIRCALGWGAR